MNEETKQKLLDGWGSKKWLFFVVSMVCGISLEIFTAGISAEMVGLLLGLPASYGILNVQNKKAVLGAAK